MCGVLFIYCSTAPQLQKVILKWLAPEYLESSWCQRVVASVVGEGKSLGGSAAEKNSTGIWSKTQCPVSDEWKLVVGEAVYKGFPYRPTRLPLLPVFCVPVKKASHAA